MEKKFNKIIEDRIKRWELENPQKMVSGSVIKPYPVITISREFGARGAALAAHLEKKIGFKVWDREILQSVADKLGSDLKFLESLDESRIEAIEDLVVGFMKNINSNYNYIRTLREVIKTIEEHGNSVIVGRGANYICEGSDSLHLRIVAPLKKRIVDYAAREGISENEARSVIDKTDQERSEFIQYHFKKDVNDASDYDLVLNLESFDMDDMMLIIMEAYERKTGIKLEVMD